VRVRVWGQGKGSRIVGLSADRGLMFERYNDKARRVIIFARHEAAEYGASEIETEHVLLGLARVEKDWLPGNATLPSIRKQIESRVKARPKPSTVKDLPLSQSSLNALKFAAEESERFGHHYVGPKHLLLGLMREKACLAATVLRRMGLRLAALRKQVYRTIAGAEHRGESNTLPIGAGLELAPTPDVLQILSRAVREAKDLSQPFLGPEHILLGLLGEENSMAAKILQEFGVNLLEVRQKLKR